MLHSHKEQDAMEALTNWAGSFTYSAARLHRPGSFDELRELIVASEKLRILGTRHSFNTIADTPEDLISLERLNQVVSLDQAAHTVTVEAGIRYGELSRWLQGEGFALRNLASLPHISVAGACATATHGSGDKNSNLATAVAALELITADGETVTLTRERDGELRGAVVGLGSVGVVARLTLEVVPSFILRQDRYQGLALGQLEANFDAIMGSAYSVSCFTDWCNDERTNVIVKRHLPSGEAGEVATELFGARRAERPQHPIEDMPIDNLTDQHGLPGPWHERLPHFRLEATPSSGEELQSEYFVPRSRAAEAVRALRELGPQVAPQLLIAEVRSIAADELWMSPCYRQDSVGLHFTWRKNWPAVRELLPLVEARLEPLGARPHWGKLFTMAPATLQARYERLGDFRQLLERYDPQGKLRNPFVEQYIWGS
jgi:xylitol oxidase